MKLEEHLGLSKGLHGKSIDEINLQERRYIGSLVAAADRNGYNVIRLSMNKDRPLRLIFVGEQYPDSKCDFKGLISPLLDVGDRVFSDWSIGAGLLEKSLKMPVDYSGFDVKDQIAYEDLTGQMSVIPEEKCLSKILKTLEGQLKQPDGRIYQQLYLSRALVDTHYVSTHQIAGQRVRTDSYKPDIIFMLKKMDVNYAILAPKRENLRSLARNATERRIAETAERA